MSIQDRVIAIIAEQAMLEPSDITLDSTPLKGTVASLNVPLARVVAISSDAAPGLARASTLA